MDIPDSSVHGSTWIYTRHGARFEINPAFAPQIAGRAMTLEQLEEIDREQAVNLDTEAFRIIRKKEQREREAWRKERLTAADRTLRRKPMPLP